ncbi:MAG: RIP metalloprotease RseP [Bacteroidaceae bacterium]|nr:RIP metalloprotease RseP [Bacteroidaceae bacterium]
MSIFLIKAFQLILCFSLLIVLHEGGHFFFAKLFKTRVEKFYMFFNPWFHLFSTKDKWFARLFPKVAAGETEYGIGWIPLGGYVKISGMIDESMDTEQMKQPAQPYEFRSKPVWQRFLIMIGGVLVNFIIAIIIYAMILFTWGSDSLPMSSVTNGFSFNEMAESAGFRDGDIPIKADGQLIAEWNGTVFRTISEAKVVTVLRNGREIDLTMPDGGLNLLEMINQEPRFLSANVPAVIDSVLPGTPAAKAGMVSGTRILAIDGQPVTWWDDFDNIMGRKSDVLAADCSHEDSLRLRNLTVTFANPQSAIVATAATDSLGVTTTVIRLDNDYKIGFLKKSAYTIYKIEHQEYGFLASIPAGITYGWSTLKGYVSDLKYIFTKQGAKSVGSFGTIGDLFPAAWNWQAFWNITAFISIILAFMNIIPIPGLDGGHVFFLIIEAITRRPPSEKFMERAQMVGMLLLFALMGLALFNDAVKFLF